jgi:hypothetical protein
MISLRISLIAILALTGAVLFAQSDKSTGRNNGFNYERSKAPEMNDFLFNNVKPDYKIISTNSNYIELEFYPMEIVGQEKENNGENMSMYEFREGVSKTFLQSGSPDLRYRSLSVFLPSEKNNNIQILDFDVKELQGVNLAPVPQLNFINPNSRSFEDTYYTYNKNSEYTQNKFVPEVLASLENIGPLRDIIAGNLIINPMQYNPVAKTLKIYTRIRVRINFGDSPVFLNKPRNPNETALLSGSAINSSNALSWVDPKFRDNSRGRSLFLNSMLSAGDWYKIEIKDNGDGKSEGIYKITKSFLEGAGINLSGVDPRTIKVYGNGGALLKEDMALPRPYDLEEIAVYFEGEADGVFNTDDHILFYGKSVNSWSYDSTANIYRHLLNYYSRSNYYWICLNTPNNGKRMQSINSENGASPYIPSSFTEKLFYEPEENNLIGEGNLWLSFRKSPGQSFEWNISLNGLEAGSNIYYNVKLAARTICPNSSYFLVKDDYSTMSEFSFPIGCVIAGFNEWINTQSNSFVVNASQKTNGEQVKLRSTFYASNSESEGYVDYHEILYKRRFNSVAGDFIKFDSPDTNSLVEYNVSSFTNDNIRVFDATVHNEVKLIQPISSSASNVKFQKTEIANQLSSYFVVGQTGYKNPTSISSRVGNQNLHGITDGASFIIITHKDFISAAERIKSRRENGGPSNPEYLKTLIITTDQIYNEFSGGVLDAVAIRDFVKFAFDTWPERPSYVCLLGDGGFDYKNIQTQGGNYVPAWEKTDPNIHQVYGLTTDDFFVNVIRGPEIVDRPDLAVGRIPANSIADANTYIDKISEYESGQNNGYWKNKMLFVADDEHTTAPNCEYIYHLSQCETLGEEFAPAYIDKIKVYLVTYPTVITPQGRRKPQVNADIAKYWNEGVLNIHYTGHGSPDVWAHEYVLEKDNILSMLANPNRYPFVSIASCDMSKFDNPANQSAGELFMMASRKGAIGTVAASRPVYAATNAAFFYSVFSNLYIPRDTLLLQKRFGTALFNTKQQISYQDNDAKYILMCDPTIRVQMPRFRSHVDSISGLTGDTMKALSRIKIYGSIIRPDSSKWTDYNGKMVLKIYDTDKQVVYNEDCSPIIEHHFRQNGGIIYSGTQTVTNGNWVAEYIVPRDISYLNQPGRLINYFYNTEYDGAGINRNFIVGGINPDAEIDSVGPRISLFLNNRNFRTGDIVSENFKLIADLFDESGINTTGTIGHKIEAIFDGNENNKYDLTTFYNSDSSYTSGSLEYDFSSIAAGRHNMRLRAWDTYNNSSEALIDFEVSSNGTLQVMNIYNYPNPFRDNTAFTFQHNYPSDINVKIKVYTVAGRMIKEIDKPNISDKFVVIDWDGKDQDGETLGNGVYIYKLTVESADGGSVTNTGKLAVLK